MSDCRKRDRIVGAPFQLSIGSVKIQGRHISCAKSTHAISCELPKCLLVSAGFLELSAGFLELGFCVDFLEGNCNLGGNSQKNSKETTSSYTYEEAYSAAKAASWRWRRRRRAI